MTSLFYIPTNHNHPLGAVKPPLKVENKTSVFHSLSAQPILKTTLLDLNVCHYPTRGTKRNCDDNVVIVITNDYGCLHAYWRAQTPTVRYALTNRTRKLDITRQFISFNQSIIVIIIPPSELLGTCIRNVRGLNVSRCTGCPEWDFFYFSQPPQTSAGMTPRLGHDHFFPNTFQFIIPLFDVS